MTAIRCRAALSWRLPDRVIRTRPAVLPDHTGIGRTPLWRANAASLLKRATPAASPTSLAAVSSPQPGIASRTGATLRDPLTDALGQRVDRLGEAGDVGQLVARQLGDQTGHGYPASHRNSRRCLARSSDARFRARAGIQLMDPPQQPVDRRRALAPQGLPVDPPTTSAPATPRRGRPPADRVHAAPPAPPPTHRSDQTCPGCAPTPGSCAINFGGTRTTCWPAGQQISLQPRRQMPAILDRPHQLGPELRPAPRRNASVMARGGRRPPPSRPAPGRPRRRRRTCGCACAHRLQQQPWWLPPSL